MIRRRGTKRIQLLILFTATSLVLTMVLTIVELQEESNVMINRQRSQPSIHYRVHDEFETRKSRSVSVYYRLSRNTRYHYEFRFELNTAGKNDDYRLMIVLLGGKHECRDMWDFSVGDRILSALRNAGYSILVICSKGNMHDTNLPIEKNKDVKYTYLALQRWMKKIYYPKFRRYPLLYVHGTGTGSKFATILCRVLPVQAQILYSFPEYREAMFVPSVRDSKLQTRLQLDPTFANWFYFDFCYNATVKNANTRKICPFQGDPYSSYSIPPTFFIFSKNDPFHTLELNRTLLTDIRRNAILLGGKLLNHTDAIQLVELTSVKPDVFYMQKHFKQWRFKPYAAQFFLEHFSDPAQFKSTVHSRQTCWCTQIDFKQFELMLNVTETWSKRRQNEYDDYVKDITNFTLAFCEEVCGDLLATNAMTSRNINRTLLWVNKMNQLRRSVYIDDYLQRPLRIWMYDKTLLLKTIANFSRQKVNWGNIAKEHQMYSPEYYLQDYFQRLNGSGNISRRYIAWTHNPLLADYFIIPSDLMFLYFNHHPSTLNDLQFKELHKKLNEEYFEPLLASVRNDFPFWTMAPRADHIGSNHILIIPGGRNMGILYNQSQTILRNVIQLAFTGVRKDLSSPNSSPQYAYRNIYITYRHHYDVVIPQSTTLHWSRSRFEDLDQLVKKKNTLFYFAGSLQHSTSAESARSQLSYIWQNIRDKQIYNTTTRIQGKEYETMTVIDGHIEPSQYIKSIQSSVFLFCPEGFLPWSPRPYESIQVGAIPILLADNVVLPFERFIDWRSFSVKINVSNIRNITNFVQQIDPFEAYITRKLSSSVPYLDAFRWPYAAADKKHIFKPEEDWNGKMKNAFHYISLELRCRRLEQWYGFTVESSIATSRKGQQQACRYHPIICPCHNEQRSLALQQYI